MVEMKKDSKSAEASETNKAIEPVIGSSSNSPVVLVPIALLIYIVITSCSGKYA